MLQMYNQASLLLWHTEATPQAIICIFHLVAIFFWSHDETDVRMRWSFSAGRCTSMCGVSNVIHKKVSESDGPSTFSSTRDIPSGE